MSSSLQDANRFTTYTPTDHQAPVWVATSIALTYAALFLIVRLVVKYKVLGWDDIFLCLAHVRSRFLDGFVTKLTQIQVLGFAQWGSTYAALDHDVGKVMEVDRGEASFPMAAAKVSLLTWRLGIILTLSKLVFASRILTLLTVGLSKCSVVLFLRQIFSGSGAKGWSICTTIFLVTCVWTVVSTITVSAGCHPNEAIQLEDQPKCDGDVSPPFQI